LLAPIILIVTSGALVLYLFMWEVPKSIFTDQTNFSRILFTSTENTKLGKFIKIVAFAVLLFPVTLAFVILADAFVVAVYAAFTVLLSLIFISNWAQRTLISFSMHFSSTVETVDAHVTKAVKEDDICK
jgi:uncharacterized membrane protein YjgN (DUF898 family)